MTFYKCNFASIENSIGSVCSACTVATLVTENAVSRYECDTSYLSAECVTGLDVMTMSDPVSNWSVGATDKSAAHFDMTSVNTNKPKGSATL